MAAFAQYLSAWLTRHEGTLPTALALDGKCIRDTVGLVCMADHETGAPLAMTKASKKEGEGRDCELKAAQRLLCEQKDLSGKLITANINAFTEALAADSRQALNLLTRRF